MADQNPSGLQSVLAVLAGAVPGILARTRGNGGTTNGVPNNAPPQLSQLLQQQANRQEYQNPLFQAVSQQAFQGLPTYARAGLALDPRGVAPTAAGAGSASGSGFSLPSALAGAGAASLFNPSLGGGKIPLEAIVNAIKKLFHHGPTGSVQGDRPAAGGTGLPIGNPGMPTVSDPWLLSDPGVYYGSGGGATVSDPSGGTGIGPGLQSVGYQGGGTFSNGDEY